MSEHNIKPLWVGMDVDAELARYEAQDRRRAEVAAPASPGPQRPSRRRGLRAAIPTLGKGGLPRVPLTA